jgi:hypothetical protein
LWISLRIRLRIAWLSGLLARSLPSCVGRGNRNAVEGGHRDHPGRRRLTQGGLSEGKDCEQADQRRMEQWRMRAFHLGVS